MGCLVTKRSNPSSSTATFLLELNPYLFRVANVDDSGEEQNHGLLEIQDQELLFHQASSLTILRNQHLSNGGTTPSGFHGTTQQNGTANGSAGTGENPPPIHWPLKSLRRYGFDADLFSFESGRRCATGPGIYAFRCDRAETLFNLVQDSIIRLGQAEEEEAARRLLAQTQPMTGHNTTGGVAFTSLTNGFGRFNGPTTAPVLMANQSNGPFSNRGELQNRQHQFNRSVSSPARETDHGYMNDSALQSHDYRNQPPTGGSSLPWRADGHRRKYLNNYINHSVDPNSQTVQYAQLMVTSHARTGSLSDEEDNYDERDCFEPDSTQGKKYVNLSKVGSGVFDCRHSALVPSHLRKGRAANHGAAVVAASTSQAALETNLNYINVTSNAIVDGNKELEETALSDSLPNQVNYIQLDLDNYLSSDTGAAPVAQEATEPPRRGVLKSDSGTSRQHSPRPIAGSISDSYATIDLRRTRAISCRAVHAENFEEGSRKTRHNSNIES